MLDRQKFYDTARVGMILQGTRGYNKDQAMCAYRGEKLTKCAVGFNVPDEYYFPKMKMGVFAKEWGLRP